MRWGCDGKGDRAHYIDCHRVLGWGRPLGEGVLGWGLEEEKDQLCEYQDEESARHRVELVQRS